MAESALPSLSFRMPFAFAFLCYMACKPAIMHAPLNACPMRLRPLPPASCKQLVETIGSETVISIAINS